MQRTNAKKLETIIQTSLSFPHEEQEGTLEISSAIVEIYSALVKGGICSDKLLNIKLHAFRHFEETLRRTGH